MTDWAAVQPIHLCSCLIREEEKRCRVMTKKVCLFPQYKCCGKTTCQLYPICSALPYLSDPGYDNRFLRINVQDKSFEETAEHQRKYAFYNRLFGDNTKRLRYQREYYREYYAEHREEILAKKRKPTSHHLSVVQQGYCNQDCVNCSYEDCILPEYEDRTEYMKLYYSRFHTELLKQKARYRADHRQYLRNSEKIRNYRKKGYLMSYGILAQTDHPSFQKMINTEGDVTVFPIGKEKYLSFITKDRNDSFRFKISSYLNDLSRPGCTEAWYQDCDGHSYTFTNPQNVNPLWETEKSTL